MSEKRTERTLPEIAGKLGKKSRLKFLLQGVTNSSSTRMLSILRNTLEGDPEKLKILVEGLPNEKKVDLLIALGKEERSNFEFIAKLIEKVEKLDIERQKAGGAEPTDPDEDGPVEAQRVPEHLAPLLDKILTANLTPKEAKKLEAILDKRSAK